MKITLKTVFVVTVLLVLHSCLATATTYDAPLEPGQTVYQRQGAVRTTNNTVDNTYIYNSIPEPSQLQMKSLNNNNIPEPGQLQMKSSNDDNIPEPGQQELKTEDDDNDNDNDNSVPEPGQLEMKTDEDAN